MKQSLSSLDTIPAIFRDPEIVDKVECQVDFVLMLVIKNGLSGP